MKTILTTIFAIALMVFAFNTNPVIAGSGDGIWASNQVDELENLEGESGTEKEVADSGNEGTTSAAQESDQ
ncbi:MAG: hypothetical protein OXE98_00660 [Hyphomicrobiales bacterium]|nr:hypothetical protein [Hyphomicrobiales bacterium]